MQGLIPFIRIGRAIRYRQRDLDAALDALTIVSDQSIVGSFDAKEAKVGAE